MKHIMKVAVVVVLCVAMVSGLFGCASPGKSAAAGAGIGAVVGGVLGYLVGGRSGAVWGAAIGAAVGGAGGYLYGEYLQKQTMDKEQVLRDNPEFKPDDPSATVVLKDLQISAEPAEARAEEEISLNASYTVLVPSNVKLADVTEARFFRDSSGSQIMSKENTTSVETGQWSSTMPLKLPRNMPEGNYDYIVQVRAGDNNLSEMTRVKVAYAPDGKVYAYLDGRRVKVSTDR